MPRLVGYQNGRHLIANRTTPSKIEGGFISSLVNVSKGSTLLRTHVIVITTQPSKSTLFEFSLSLSFLKILFNNIFFDVQCDKPRWNFIIRKCTHKKKKKKGESMTYALLQEKC